MQVNRYSFGINQPYLEVEEQTSSLDTSNLTEDINIGVEEEKKITVFFSFKLFTWLEISNLSDEKAAWQAVKNNEKNMSQAELTLFKKLDTLEKKPSIKELHQEKVIQCNDGKLIMINGFVKEALCLDSFYFKALWKGNFKEIQLREKVEVLSSEEFKALIMALYTPSSLTIEQADALLDVATLLRADDLIERCKRCVHCLVDYIKECQYKTFESVCENVYTLLQKAELYSNYDIQKACQIYFNKLANHFLSQKDDEFKNFLSFIKHKKEIQIKSLHINKESILKRVCSFPFLEELYFLSYKDLTDKELVYLNPCLNLKKIDFYSITITDQGLTSLSKLSSLEELKLRRCQTLNDESLALLSQFPKLKKITIDDSNITGQGLANFSALSSLEEIEFSFCKKLTDEGVTHLSQCLKLKKIYFSSTNITGKCLASFSLLPSLEDLMISDCRKLTDDNLSVFILSSQCLKLKKLNLESVDITGQSLAALSSLSSLEWILLFRCQNLDDESIASLGQCPKLKKINLAGTSITGQGLAALESLTSLEEINLWGCNNLTDAGVAHLAKCKNLKIINLSQTSLKGQCLNSFSSLNSLEELSLQKCQNLTDKMMTPFAKYPKVKKIDLSYTNLTDQCLTSFSLLPSLEWLNLSECKNLTEKNLALLTEWLVPRNINIWHDYNKIRNI